MNDKKEFKLVCPICNNSEQDKFTNGRADHPFSENAKEHTYRQFVCYVCENCGFVLTFDHSKIVPLLNPNIIRTPKRTKGRAVDSSK